MTDYDKQGVQHKLKIVAVKCAWLITVPVLVSSVMLCDRSCQWLSHMITVLSQHATPLMDRSWGSCIQHC
jgi:hypothetical protein